MRGPSARRFRRPREFHAFDAGLAVQAHADLHLIVGDFKISWPVAGSRHELTRRPAIFAPATAFASPAHLGRGALVSATAPAIFDDHVSAWFARRSASRLWGPRRSRHSPEPSGLRCLPPAPCPGESKFRQSRRNVVQQHDSALGVDGADASMIRSGEGAAKICRGPRRRPSPARHFQKERSCPAPRR